MKKTALAALALGTGCALLAGYLPATAAKYTGAVTVPYTVTTEPASSWYFGYTGAGQTLEIPQTGYYAVRLWGAAGGLGTPYGPVYYPPAGAGGSVAGVLEFVEGDVLTIQVGGKGGQGTGVDAPVGGTDDQASFTPGDGGYNGGGAGSGFIKVQYAQAGGGGGGATDVRLNGNDLTDRVIVAGGGGGAGGGSTRMPPSVGGAGGSGSVVASYFNGVYGFFYPGNDGGDNHFHVGGVTGYGQFGIGGNSDEGGGGGGGGWYGGDGCAGNGGGGGGSSYINATIGAQAGPSLIAQLPGPDDSIAAHVDGYGYAIITYLGTAAPANPQSGQTIQPGAAGGLTPWAGEEILIENYEDVEDEPADEPFEDEANSTQEGPAPKPDTAEPVEDTETEEEPEALEESPGEEPVEQEPEPEPEHAPEQEDEQIPVFPEEE